jgi:hypothetical protein
MDVDVNVTRRGAGVTEESATCVWWRLTNVAKRGTGQMALAAAVVAAQRNK